MNPYLVPMGVLLLGSGWMSGSETALFSLYGSRRAVPATARRLLADPSRLLTTILAGNLLVNLAFFATAAAWAVTLPLAQAVQLEAAALLALFLLGEVLPKLVAQRFAHPFAAATAPLLLPLCWLASPLCRLIQRVAPERATPSDRLDAADLDALLAAEGDALLGPEEARLLRRLLALGHQRIGVLREPIAQRLSVPAAMSVQEATSLLRASRVTWALVDDEQGEPVGLFDLAYPAEGARVADRIRKLPVVPDLAPLAAGLRALRENGSPCVLLVDEHGAVSGLVARGRWADLLLDRLPPDHPGDLPAIVPLGCGRWLVDAALPLDLYREQFGLAEETSPRADTVGGLLVDRLGRIATPGDRLVMGDWEWIVVRVDEVRPRELEFRPVAYPGGSP